MASREIATTGLDEMKKVRKCKSEISKAPGNVRNSDSDDTRERFDEEGNSFSKEDLLDGDGRRQPQAAKAARRGRSQNRHIMGALTVVPPTTIFSRAIA
jgi:hypothetical protein